MTADAGIRCAWMRGGTSKAAVFLASDLPTDPHERDQLLLRIMGTPDPTQIDGVGGATSLTSKVAVVSPSAGPDTDVDYLFLQVGVEDATVSAAQNCGNILAAVGPFAIERGLVAAQGEEAEVRIKMVNSDSTAVATFPLAGQKPRYDGIVAISGVPGAGAGIRLDFANTRGSATGALFPTGDVTDEIDGTQVTCVDNGMPVVVVEPASLGITGYETTRELLADDVLLNRVNRLRQVAGLRMGLGETSASSVPKTVVVAPPVDGGRLCTRSFIPTRPHTSLGVLAAVSTVTALLTPGSVGHELTRGWPDDLRDVDVEHPSGHLLVAVAFEQVDPQLEQAGSPVNVLSSGVVRTARMLFDGVVYPRPCS